MFNEIAKAKALTENMFDNDNNAYLYVGRFVEKDEKGNFKIKNHAHLLTIVARRFLFHTDDLSKFTPLPLDHAERLGKIYEARDKLLAYCKDENSELFKLFMSSDKLQSSKDREAFKKCWTSKIASMSYQTGNETNGQNHSTMGGIYNLSQIKYADTHYIESIIADAVQLGELKKYTVSVQDGLLDAIVNSNKGTKRASGKVSAYHKMIIDIIAYIELHKNESGYALFPMEQLYIAYKKSNKNDSNLIRNSKIIIDDESFNIFTYKPVDPHKSFSANLMKVEPKLLEKFKVTITEDK